MELSLFGQKFTSKSGILQLMDDLGKPLPPDVPAYRLGGGNPARIPEIEKIFRREVVGDVAAALARDVDLLPRLFVAFEDEDVVAARGRRIGGHQPGRARPDDDHLFHRISVKAGRAGELRGPPALPRLLNRVDPAAVGEIFVDAALGGLAPLLKNEIAPSAIFGIKSAKTGESPEHAYFLAREALLRSTKDRSIFLSAAFSSLPALNFTMARFGITTSLSGRVIV